MVGFLPGSSSLSAAATSPPGENDLLLTKEQKCSIFDFTRNQSSLLAAEKTQAEPQTEPQTGAGSPGLSQLLDQ